MSSRPRIALGRSLHDLLDQARPARPVERFAATTSPGPRPSSPAPVTPPTRLQESGVAAGPPPAPEPTIVPSFQEMPQDSTDTGSKVIEPVGVALQESGPLPTRIAPRVVILVALDILLLAVAAALMFTRTLPRGLSMTIALILVAAGAILACMGVMGRPSPHSTAQSRPTQARVRVRLTRL